MRTIYVLNVKGNVIYGECDFYEYPRIARNAEGDGFACSIIEDAISDEAFSEYPTKQQFCLV